MHKFCCNKFKFLYSAEKQMGLNIRIVKPSKEFLERAKIKIDKTYFITEGYSENIDKCIKKIAIQYCPFCGADLKKFYASDELVQETVTP